MERKISELNGISIVLGEKMKEASEYAEARINYERMRAGYPDLTDPPEESEEEDMPTVE